MSDLSLASENHGTQEDNITSTGGEDGGETASEDNAESPDEEQRNIRIEFHFLIMKLRIQHRLAHRHFRVLGALFHSGPLIFVALFSGILSFLSASANKETTSNQTGTNITEGVNGTNFPQESVNQYSPNFITPETREAFIIIIGVLSLVQVAIQKIGQALNHTARSDMHLQVDMSLGHLLNEMNFEEKKAALATDNLENSLTPETLSKFQALFNQCVDSCSSPIPIKIALPFDLMDHYIWFFLKPRKVRKMDEMILWYHLALDEIYSEICNGSGWQVNLPSPKKITDRVEKTLEKQWMKQKGELEENNLCIS